jgi:hypothetical protein
MGIPTSTVGNCRRLQVITHHNCDYIRAKHRPRERLGKAETKPASGLNLEGQMYKFVV